LGPIPLSIATTPPNPGREPPYRDRLGDDGFIHYHYFKDDPAHPDNAGLRLALRERVPLIYLYGQETGIYSPLYPVLIVGDDPAACEVIVQLQDRASLLLPGNDLAAESSDALRTYVTRTAKMRLHQVGFRTRVLRAYRQSCAMCRLRQVPLLDAAHILPDGHPRGDPVVPNGLALCKLHHAAFDGNLLGVRPDARIEVARRILDEEDGPMLVHGLQHLHGAKLFTPAPTKWHPDPDRLAERFEEFRRAS
jgi:putative restriction endonuclease